MASRTQNQVVRLTRCLDVPSHTAMLVRVMIEAGYRWYPEYTVEEQYRDFNQSQYLCTVRIFPSYPGSTEPLHCSYGLGVTIEMSMLDAAYSMMTIMRARTALLQNTDFRYMPASLRGAEGYFTTIYTDSSHEDSLLRTTAQMLEDKDRENRALRLELFNSRSDHWATLTRFAPVVQARYMDMRDLYPMRSSLPDRMDWRDVGGITPPRGPHLPPFAGPRPHPCPYGPQAPEDRLFPDDHVQLPGHGGNLYEDYYGDV
ncbi:hypothetical protein VPH35_129470 [Triticum aestivum]